MGDAAAWTVLGVVFASAYLANIWFMWLWLANLTVTVIPGGRLSDRYSNQQWTRFARVLFAVLWVPFLLFLAWYRFDERLKAWYASRPQGPDGSPHLI